MRTLLITTMTTTLIVMSLVSLPVHAEAPVDLTRRKARLFTEPRKDARVTAIFGALELWDGLEDPAPLVDWLEQVRQRTSETVELRGLAGHLASIARDRRGDDKGGAALRTELGFIDALAATGPFDESGVKKTRFMEGVPIDRAFVRGGRVALDRVFGVDHDARGTMATCISVPKNTRALVWVGGTGRATLKVDRARMWQDGRVAYARPDQASIGVELDAGWHEIALDVAANDGQWAAYLRVTDESGKKAFDAQASSCGAKKLAAARPWAWKNLEARLRARARDKANHAERVVLAAFLAGSGWSGARTTEVEDLLDGLIERASPSLEVLRLVAFVHHDANRRMSAITRALALASLTAVDRAELLQRQGELWSSAGRQEHAERAWKAACTAHTSAIEPALKLAELAADRGLVAESRRLIDLIAARSKAPLVLRARARIAWRSGDVKDALSAIAQALSANTQDSDALRLKVAIERSRGELRAAVATYDRLFAIEGLRTQDLVATAELLEAARESEAALTRVEAAIAMRKEAALFDLKGRLLHRLGRDDAAKAALAEALELKPQNPELREYIAWLSADAKSARTEAFVRTHRVDATPLVARARKQRASAGDSARVLLDARSVRIHENGLSDAYQQRLVEVLDARGVRELDEMEIRYAPDSQSVDVRGARVYKAGGEVIEMSDVGDRDLSEPWYGTYYDVHARVVAFSNIAVGDILEVEYVVSDVGRDNYLGDYFGDIFFLQDDKPHMESRYTVVAPVGRALYFNAPKLAGLEHKKVEAAQGWTYSFIARDVPKVTMEAGMPGFFDVAAYVHVSTFRSWQEVARFYRGLIQEQLVPDANLKRIARKLVAGKRSTRDRVAAIYDYVVRMTRYVALEFGVHGYKPYRVSQVLERKFGDCKDKASLLVAMLREVGIPAELVLLRTRRGGDVDRDPPSLAPFDHAIAYVPELKWFLDGTAEFSGPQELPTQDEDVLVLLVDDGVLVRTPTSAPGANRSQSHLDVKLAADGGAELEERLVVEGRSAQEWRSHYQTEGERLERYGKAWSARRPGARVDRVEMPTIQNRLAPVEVRARVQIADWARKEGEARLSVPLLAEASELVRSQARLSTRKQALVLSSPWREEEEVVLHVPKEYRVERMPKPVSLSTEFGEFQLHAFAEGDRVIVRAMTELRCNRVDVARYGAFRAFLAEIDAATAGTIDLERR